MVKKLGQGAVSGEVVMGYNKMRLYEYNSE